MWPNRDLILLSIKLDEVKETTIRTDNYRYGAKLNAGAKLRLNALPEEGSTKHGNSLILASTRQSSIIARTTRIIMLHHAKRTKDTAEPRRSIAKTQRRGLIYFSADGV